MISFFFIIFNQLISTKKIELKIELKSYYFCKDNNEKTMSLFRYK